MTDKIVSINCSRETRFQGSQVTGTVNLNTRLAKKKDITAVKVSLKARIRTWVKEGKETISEDELIFKIEHTLWSNDTALPDHPYEIIRLPFSLTIPDDADLRKPLPPSICFSNSRDRGLIQYYVHCIAEKRAWYRRNTRVNAPFPFLPLDRTPSLDFGSWTGPWAVMKRTIKVRPNLSIFGSQGMVEVSVYLPSADSLPLFVRIPCRIHIICCSKLMCSSRSLDPTSFTFPRNPKMTDISLELTQHRKIVANNRHRRHLQPYGLLGGFGTLQNQADIEMKMSDPVWVPEEGDGVKGKWTESVTYSTYLVLRCPPPINTRLIRTEKTNIETKIEFPGLGNTWKASIGPLPISSGVKPWQQTHRDQGVTDYDIALPPSYWEVMGEDDGDGKDEKE